MAKGEGGLRSGPAANKTWTLAFQHLEKGKIPEGVKELAKERRKWLDRYLGTDWQMGHEQGKVLLACNVGKGRGCGLRGASVLPMSAITHTPMVPIWIANAGM